MGAMDSVLCKLTDVITQRRVNGTLNNILNKLLISSSIPSTVLLANTPAGNSNKKTKAGISGYNAGCGNVQTYDGMDIGTTGNDYSSDVVSRANYYRDNNLQTSYLLTFI